MVKEKEEILEKLRRVRKIAEIDIQEKLGYENYSVKDVIYYNKKVELINKENGEKEEFDLCVVWAENSDTGEITEFYYLEEQEIDFTELLKKYESLKPIKELVDATKENDEKTEEEQDKELKKESLEDLEKEERIENKKDKSDNKDEPVLNKKISNLKGEVDLDQQVNGETLRKILDLGEEYDSIAPVRAASIGVSSASEYIFVAVKNDKTCTVLGEDKIQEDRQKGTNPEEKDLLVNNDGSLTEKSSLANFRIVNRVNFVMSVRFDENSSTKETTISDVSGRESRANDVAQELHKDGDERIDDDVRNFIREENGIDESADMRKRQTEHEEFGCENDRIENIDENTSNDIHTHIEKDWKELAIKWGYYKDGRPDEEKAKKTYEEYKYNNPHLTDEEVVQEVSDDLYEQVPGRNSRQ